MSSSNEAITQIRELEKAIEELKEIKQHSPGWLELSKMTEQPDCSLEAFVNKAVCPGPAGKHVSPCKMSPSLGPGHAAGTAGRQTSSKKRPQGQLQIKMFGFNNNIYKD